MKSLPALPPGWDWVTLDALLTYLRNGISKKPDAELGSGTPILRISAVRAGRVNIGDVRYLAVEEGDYSNYELAPGDLLLTRYNGNPDFVGVAAVMPSFVGTILHPDKVIRAKLDSSKVDPKYAAFAINSGTSREFVASRIRTTAGQAGISGGDVRAIPLPLAPPKQQRAIVTALETQFSRIDSGVDALKRVQANLRRYRASVLKAACEGRLVPTEAELARRESRDYEPASVLLQRILKERRRDWEATELAKFKAKGKSPTDDGWKGKYKAVETQVASNDSVPPEGWVVVRLADIAEVRLGRQRSPERATGPHMCPYLRAANVTWAGIDTSDVKEMDFTPAERKIYRLQKGDILMSEASGSVSEVGKPAIWHDEIADCCFQNTLLRVRAPANLGEFLFWQLMADARLGQFEDHAPGVGIHHLGAERLSGWLIRLPPQLEQTRIVFEIQRRLSLSAALEEATSRALRRSEGLRQSVLKDAFAGKLVPPSALPAAGIERTAEIVAKREKRRSVTELSDV